MKNLKPFAFLTLLTLGACTSTESGVGKNTTLDKPEKKAPTKNTNLKPKPNQGTSIKNTSVQAKPAPATPLSKKIAGLYFARLPCPNCGSVRVNLVLESDFTYDKTEEHNTNNDIFFDSGNWTFQNGKITLTPVGSSKATHSTIRKFRHEKGGLTMLTEQGETFPGKPGDYQFKKK